MREARGPERTEREARRSNRAPQARSNLRAKRVARDENVPAKRADFLVYVCMPVTSLFHCTSKQPFLFESFSHFDEYYPIFCSLLFTAFTVSPSFTPRDGKLWSFN